VVAFWETPQGQRRIALLSGAVMLLMLWLVLRSFFGILIIPLALCAGLWELHEWGKEWELAKRFEHIDNEAMLQAELARLDRPDRVVQTPSGRVEVRGFDSKLD
jgi:hypothetical protein